MITTKITWIFRCDRCNQTARFGADNEPAPPLREMIETLTLDGWVINADLARCEHLILPSVHKIICPMHVDLERVGD